MVDPRGREPRGTPRRPAARAAGLLLAAAAIPTAVFQIANLFPGWQVGIILVGLVLLVALVVYQARAAARKVEEETAETNAIDEIRITMKRALGPIATLLAEMPNLKPMARRAHLNRVSDRAAVSLADYLLRHIPNVRASVFWINDSATTLFPVSHAGAGEPPGAFERGRTEAESNLAWVRTGGKPRRVDNYRIDPGADPSSRYSSYIAVVIRAGTDAYGMVTVDSTEPDAFTSTDEETVSVIAGLLASACAMAYPGDTRPSPRE